MGVYIQDLGLPTSEVEPLKFELYADGTVFSQKKVDDIYEFHAVELPPHGRLIDADALTTVTEMVNGEFKTYIEVFEVVDAPTIIESEGEDGQR